MIAALPSWLTHALHTPRGPIPWNAVVRAALTAGPLLLVALLLDQVSLGAFAAIGAMLAGLSDRPGSRRSAVKRIGVPVLVGAAGVLVGTYAGEYSGAGPVALTVLLTLVGLLVGCVSAAGPVASASGTQALVALALGAGMTATDPGWARALAFAFGGGWLLLLALVQPAPGAVAVAGTLRSALRAEYHRFDGERAAVAAVYDAIAALLDATGTPGAVARRAALTAALDQAQDALAGPRLRRYVRSKAERRLHAQYAAALPLAEAATALFWAGDPVPGRAAEGPRRLAAAVRGGAHTGPLPAPSRHAPGLRALDDALLRAAEVFDRPEDSRHPGLHRRYRSAKGFVRAALGPGGREYGVRVAVSYGVSAAVAQALHHEYWYWMPVTAVFLVKPDLGPLVSRVLSRAAGTVLGALVFAGFAALLPRPAGLVALVALSGALIPVALRHFAAMTAVATVIVLALVELGGAPQATWTRIGETLLACAIVLLVGHLPVPGQRAGGVRARLERATEAAHAYLRHVLGAPDDRARRWTLRREAYRTLAEARAAIDLAAAELPALARQAEGAADVAATLERLVDTTTACAVHLDDEGRLVPAYTRRIDSLLDELAERRRRIGLDGGPDGAEGSVGLRPAV
ncbi:FUSC family protein [Streptomyces poonensis]|uniref:FUSC family protein n=1 Tax=Streptomyces poonensis TaxID=68255 RepID=A0A918Q398_9ACTN|nr:FUSC family protein [Streptomyces poonensis]GGZ30744.1 FUSC family protein [Streptomyces poonensis]GLJ88229.1 FUSC family protein [Streptomyces poonensis]